MNTEEQLRRWVNGDPVHDDEQGICVPDFSCCRGKDKLAALEERQKFFEAYQAKDTGITDGMLMMFLSKVLNEDLEEGVKVHVAGFHYDP